VPADYHWAIVDAERVLTGGPAPAVWRQLEDLLRVARENGVSAERTFASYEASAHEARASFAGVFSGAIELGIYLILLAVILGVVLGVYSIFVLPAFETMFAQFGAPLPAFTAATIGNGWIALPVIGLVVILLVVYLAGLRRLRRRLDALQPVLPLLRVFPILRDWARAHDAALWMRYFAIFLDAGANEAGARRAAMQLAGEPQEHRARLLESAAHLGRLRASLARMLETDGNEAAERFEHARNSAFSLLRVIVYVVVASYVLAMYLPIFKLGGIV
jgi:type II secretory pathway component PulF